MYYFTKYVNIMFTNNIRCNSPVKIMYNPNLDPYVKEQCKEFNLYVSKSFQIYSSKLIINM